MQSFAFFEAKLKLDFEVRERLPELLASLNRANRKAWAWAARNAVDPRAATAAKLLGSGVLRQWHFTSHQEGMVARKLV